MTMHLEGPWLSTTGRRKGKFKWTSAEAKHRDQQLKQEWETLKSSFGSTKSTLSRPMTRPLPKLGPPPGRETPYIPSRDSGIGVAAKKDAPVYTGDKIVGIGTLHKSNAVPIFSNQEAVDLSRMRR